MGVTLHCAHSFNDTIVSRSSNLQAMMELSSTDLKVLKESSENNFIQFEVDEEIFALSVRDISGRDCIVPTCLSNNSLNGFQGGVLSISTVSEVWSQKITQKIEALKPVYSTYVHNKITKKCIPPS